MLKLIITKIFNCLHQKTRFNLFYSKIEWSKVFVVQTPVKFNFLKHLRGDDYSHEVLWPQGLENLLLSFRRHKWWWLGNLPDDSYRFFLYLKNIFAKAGGEVCIFIYIYFFCLINLKFLERIDSDFISLRSKVCVRSPSWELNNWNQVYI